MDATCLLVVQEISGAARALLNLMWSPDDTALPRVELSQRWHPLTSSAGVPRQYDFRNSLMSMEYAEVTRMVADLR